MNLFQKDRLLFIPIVCSYAAKLAQISVREMFISPTYLANAIHNVQRLIGYDGVVNIFDPSLEAEACGCSVEWPPGYELSRIASSAEGIEKIELMHIEKKGRIPVAVEATKRLSIMAGKDVAVMAVLTGPLTLSFHLAGFSIIEDFNNHHPQAERIIEWASELILMVTKTYCEQNVDIVVVNEKLLNAVNDDCLGLMGSMLSPIWNVGKFYNAHTAIILGYYKNKRIFQELGAEIYFLSGRQDKITSYKELASEHGIVIGYGFPQEILTKPTQEFKQYLEKVLPELKKGPFFLTTDGDVSKDTPVENMHMVMRQITI